MTYPPDSILLDGSALDFHKLLRIGAGQAAPLAEMDTIFALDLSP